MTESTHARPRSRGDHRRHVVGEGRFAGDQLPDGTLHAAFVRSHEANGRILEISSATARHAPGVVALYGGDGLDLRPLPAPTVAGHQPSGMDMPMLATHRVAFVGQAIAVVIAESPQTAVDALDHVDVVIEPETPVTAVDSARSHDSLVHPDAGTNLVLTDTTQSGPVPTGDLVESTVVVEHARLAPSALEPLSILVTPANGSLHAVVGVQSPHLLCQQLATVLGMPPHQIRVTVPDVGGAFGLKRFYPEYAVVAAAARMLGRPVAWTQSRREAFLMGTHGRSQRHEVTLHATTDGRIGSARIRLETDAGAYPHRGAQIGLFSRLVASGLYDIPRLEFDLTVAVTNTPPMGPYRGAGRPEAALAMERAVDALARRLEMDPAELRRINLIRRLPHTTPTGASYDSGDYVQAFDRALALADYDGVRREQAERRLDETGPALGIGLGAFVERAGGAPDSWEFGSVEVAEDGRIIARSGSTSAGQGHADTWCRVVGDRLGVDPDAVTLYTGDTEDVPDSTGSFASRSVQIGAAALWRCADAVREAAVDVAADVLGADPGQIELHDGFFWSEGRPSMSWGEVARHARASGVELAASERFSPGVQTFPYGVHVAIVEVDLDTGWVNPRRLIAVDDVGVVLDEQGVAGQAHGSAAQGLGAALLEHMRYDDRAQPLTTTFVDYLLPTAVNMPPLTTSHLVHPAPSNPLGAKGAGEGGCIGMPAALLNATIDALAPWGVTELQLPLRPERVWTALQRARH